jgi:hypothetical protein
MFSGKNVMCFATKLKRTVQKKEIQKYNNAPPN